MTIAILAMQGAFLEHGQMLDRLGVEHFEIRKKEDLDRTDPSGRGKHRYEKASDRAGYLRYIKRED